jgi:hypothetical protein
MRAPVIDKEIDTLSDYLTLFVEPTFVEYQKQPHSTRLAFLTCVAIFHSIDRASHPKSSANLRKEWRRQSIDFWIVDIFAHRLKHVRSSDEKFVSRKPGLSVCHLVNNMDFHNFYYVMRDAIAFVRRQADAIEPQSRSCDEDRC